MYIYACFWANISYLHYVVVMLIQNNTLTSLSLQVNCTCCLECYLHTRARRLIRLLFHFYQLFFHLQQHRPSC